MTRSAGNRLVLASRSPRRRELLEAFGFEVAVLAADVSESRVGDESPLEMVRRLALLKATTVAARLADRSRDADPSIGPDLPVIAADTAIDLDGEPLGQPASADAAIATLELLSGRSHLVHTGVAVVKGSSPVTGTVTTTVTFRPLDLAEIHRYVRAGEPLDRAGAYAVQGGAGGFVERVEGPVDNVVGLPLALVCELMGA